MKLRNLPTLPGKLTRRATGTNRVPHYIPKLYDMIFNRLTLTNTVVAKFAGSNVKFSKKKWYDVIKRH